jgi:hypothetical protein
MFRRRPATSTHETHAERGDEFPEHLRHRCRLEGIDRVTGSRVERKAGVRNAGDREGGVGREVAHRFPHVLRTRRTIQTDHIHAQGFEGHQRAGDVRSQQHASAGIERDLSLDRHPKPEVLEETLES